MNADKRHQNRIKVYQAYERLISQYNRAGKSSAEIQFKPIDTRRKVSKKTHKINRFIVAWTAYKNGESIKEAQIEYTRKIQREYRARKLREEREAKLKQM